MFGNTDPLPVQAKYRLARGALVRSSGQFATRFDDHFDGYPYDWVLAQEKPEAEQNEMVTNFHEEAQLLLTAFLFADGCGERLAT